MTLKISIVQDKPFNRINVNVPESRTRRDAGSLQPAKCRQQCPTNPIMYYITSDAELQRVCSVQTAGPICVQKRKRPANSKKFFLTDPLPCGKVIRQHWRSFFCVPWQECGKRGGTGLILSQWRWKLCVQESHWNAQSVSSGITTQRKTKRRIRTAWKPKSTAGSVSATRFIGKPDNLD